MSRVACMAVAFACAVWTTRIVRCDATESNLLSNILFFWMSVTMVCMIANDSTDDHGLVERIVAGRRRDRR